MSITSSSREIIKPSSPTPDHQRNYKPSLLDQLAPPSYFSMILFYTGESRNTVKANSEHLKKSLSETLAHFYPLAGQLKDDHFVDCNDHGVAFIETHLASDMSEIIKPPQNDIVQQLIPLKLHETTCPQPEQNLLVQVNYFGCGGMAIAICLHHQISDAATAANFLKSWSILARGFASASDFKNHVMINNNDIVAMFPARDMSSTNLFGEGLISLCSTVKRFTFDGKKITSLREKIANENKSYLDRPSRFEVVSSVILGALLAAYGGLSDRDDEFTTIATPRPTNVTAFIALNLRKRMNPPLPEQSYGNISSVATLNLPIEDGEKEINLASLAGEVHQSIRMADDQHARKLYGEGELLNILKAAAAQGQGSSKSKGFIISSWCNMPFQETDFGFGKPVSVVGMIFTECAVLVDSCDGKGSIEAWVGLPKQDMARFEQHHGILAYTTTS